MTFLFLIKPQEIPIKNHANPMDSVHEQIYKSVLHIDHSKFIQLTRPNVFTAQYMVTHIVLDQTSSNSKMMKHCDQSINFII